MKVDHRTHRNVGAVSRVLLIGEGVLSAAPVLELLRERLAARPGVAVASATVPETGRLSELLVRRWEVLGPLDFQALRWRLRWSAEAWALQRSARPYPDVVLAHTHSCALLLGGRRAPPLVVSVDATGRQYALLGYAGPHGRLAAAADSPVFELERRALRRAAAVLAWTEWTARSVVDEYRVNPERVHVGHVGIDVARFSAAARARRNGDGPLRVLFVGNQVERKGLSALLNAQARSRSGFLVDVVTADEVAERPGVSVHHGVAPRSERLVELLARADVLALPSNADAVPSVVLEGMAAGLPVVASDVGAVPELLSDAGILVPAGDSEAVAAAIDELAGDEGLRAALGARALERVTERYDVTTQMDRVAGILSAVARR
jgi:glycosyltransferase involved in cell wall biosynthesis